MTYFTLLFIYFITVNKYRFCISVIGYINVQIIGIGYKKINIGRSLVVCAMYFFTYTTVQKFGLGKFFLKDFALLRTEKTDTEDE